MPVNGNNNAAIASGVERCECPEKYSGDSCQDPADGYFRWRNMTAQTNILEELVGKVVRCECNDRSDVCDKETGECLVRNSNEILKHWNIQFVNENPKFPEFESHMKHVLNKFFFLLYFFRIAETIPAGSVVIHVLKDIMDILMKLVCHVLALKPTKTSREVVTFQRPACLVTAKKDTQGSCAIAVLRDSSARLKTKAALAKAAIVTLKESFRTNAMS